MSGKPLYGVSSREEAMHAIPLPLPSEQKTPDKVFETFVLKMAQAKARTWSSLADLFRITRQQRTLLTLVPVAAGLY